MKQIFLIAMALFAMSVFTGSMLAANSEVAIARQVINDTEVICLSNKLTSLLLDASKFTLVDIKDNCSGVGYVVEPGGSLFCVVLGKSPAKFYETQVTFSADGTGAKKRYFQVVGQGSAKSLELHFDGCPVGVDGGSVDVVVSIFASPGDPVFKWNLRLQNNSALSMGECRFPTLQGLGSQAAGSENKDYLVIPALSGTRLDSPRSKGSCGLGGLEYPTCALQMLSYCDGLGQGGLYLAAEDPLWYRKVSIACPMSSKKSFQWHVLHYADGTSHNGVWHLPYDVAFGPIQGDWYDAAKTYRRWLLSQGRMKPIIERQDIPAWFKSINVWYQGEDHNPKEELMAKTVDRLRTIRERLGEPFAFHWYLWQKGRTHDVNYPDYFPASPGFSNAITTLRNAGVRVMPYINVELFDTNLQMWTDDHADLWASRNYLGDYNKVLWGDLGSLKGPINGPKMVNMCPGTQYWQDKMVGCVKTLVQDYGVDAVYFDELHVYPFLCYATNHLHSVIGGNYFANSYREIIRRAKEECGKKDLVLTGEGESDIYADVISAQLTWADTKPDSLPMFQSVMKDYTIEFGLMMVRPEIENMDCFAGKIGFSLVRGRQLGWIPFDQGDVLDPSQTAQMDFLKSAAKCRTAARDFLLYGEYLRSPDTLSAGTHEVRWRNGGGGLASPDEVIRVPNVMASAYKAPNGDIGIVLVNVTGKDVQVSIPVNQKDWGLKVDCDCHKSVWMPESWSDTENIKLRNKLNANLPAYLPMVIRLHQKQP